MKIPFVEEWVLNNVMQYGHVGAESMAMQDEEVWPRFSEYRQE